MQSNVSELLCRQNWLSARACQHAKLLSPGYSRLGMAMLTRPVPAAGASASFPELVGGGLCAVMRFQ